MKNEILKHYKGYETLVERLDDLIDQVQRYENTMFTAFLSSNEQVIAQRFVGQRVIVKMEGGFVGAEKCRCVLSLSPVEDTSMVVCLKATYDNRFMQLSHSDLLGALLNSGIKKDQFGDCWVEDNVLVVYVTAEIAPTLCHEPFQIHRLNVNFKVSNEKSERIQNYQEFSKIVSSYRLDVIVAVLANCSRGKAQQMIHQQLVSLNHEILEESSGLCHNGDTISIRKVGRFLVQAELSVTKKNNFVLAFKKYC